ncbi:HAMP domain-containing sensor histidine kinase [Lapidilactobacillus bayanensis]|uniref:HAMP domain-containing sensor histidine kinase n=1 Tax=Lapidilactobacillus bayanensis TaxID=2485998 RepID=UPI000F7A8324|nr:HAMP domain-containing protein [Lapidilactobacillus bayanensis]
MEKLRQRLADLPIRQALLHMTLIGTLLATALILIFILSWNSLLDLVHPYFINHRLLGFSTELIGISLLFGGGILGSFLILALVMRKTADIFYQIKLAHSLEQLNYGIKQIQAQNLDFELHNSNHDELGALTQSFEQMRLALRDALQQSWRLLEDQKEVNAAFAHDLRTPLTVLQGDAEMLTTRLKQTDTQELVQDMQAQLVRVIDFIGLMSKITSLQVAPVTKQNCTPAELTNLVQREIKLVPAQLQINFVISNQIQEQSTFNLPTNAILEVLDNQLSNAKRFAKSVINLTLTLTAQTLEVRVFNDGPHLSATELANVRVPFFSQQSADHHLGVGIWVWACISVKCFVKPTVVISSLAMFQQALSPALVSKFNRQYLLIVWHLLIDS